MSQKKKGIIARGFKSTVSEEGKVHEAAKLSDYIGQLFRQDVPSTVQVDAHGSQTLETRLSPDSAYESKNKRWQTAGPTDPRYNITEEQVEDAVRRQGIKADGVDEMSTRILKRKQHRELVVSKLTRCYNRWLHRRRMPQYLKEGRLLTLSKEDTEYPATDRKSVV